MALVAFIHCANEIAALSSQSIPSPSQPTSLSHVNRVPDEGFPVNAGNDGCVGGHGITIEEQIANFAKFAKFKTYNPICKIILSRNKSI